MMSTYPQGWQTLLAARLTKLTPNWALYGSFGIGLDGANIGLVWPPSLGMIVGRVPMDPGLVQTFDELLIVLRRAAGLRFDKRLPGWHCMAPTLCKPPARRDTEPTRERCLASTMTATMVRWVPILTKLIASCSANGPGRCREAPRLPGSPARACT